MTSAESRRHDLYNGLAQILGNDRADTLSRVIAEDYDPVVTMSQIRCPYLAVYGGLDLLVPAWESARTSGDALHRAGNPDAAVVVFPGGDHRLQEPGTGEFVPGYLGLITNWAARLVAGP